MASTTNRLLKKRLASAQRAEERAWTEFRSAVAEAYIYLSQMKPAFIVEVRGFADEVVKLAQARKVEFAVFVLALAEAGVNVTKWAKERAATLRTTDNATNAEAAKEVVSHAKVTPFPSTEVAIESREVHKEGD